MIVPQKNTLIDEIKDRILSLESEMKKYKSQTDEVEKYTYIVLANEHSIYVDFLQLIEFYGRKIGYEEFIASKFTPILDYETKQPLKIGDKVESRDKKCGVLIFDEVFNEYLVKNDSGGHFRTRNYKKIDELYDYNIDTSKVECRRPNSYLKKRW